jgi:hypothetical protein
MIKINENPLAHDLSVLYCLVCEAFWSLKPCRSFEKYWLAEK